MESFQSGYTPSGSGYIKKTIRNNPTRTAAVIAVLIVIVIVLSYYLTSYKNQSGESYCAGSWDPAATAELRAVRLAGSIPPS